jgi:hypothetical protein
LKDFKAILLENVKTICWATARCRLTTEKISLKPKPGTFIFFNSYLGHEFPVDHGIEPFRFIHFNIQAVPKQLINNNIKRISS